MLFGQPSREDINLLGIGPVASAIADVGVFQKPIFGIVIRLAYANA